MTNFSGENLNSSPDPKGERRENESNKYQAYPEYKDSKVEWLGALPKNWQLAKHKYCASFKKGKNPFELMPDQGDGMLPYLSMDYLRGNSNPIYAKPEKNSYLAKEGQSLIIWDGSNAGEFVKGTLGIVSSTMAAAELFGNFTNSYYWYVCKCLEPEMRRHANGMGIPHVDGDKLKQSILPMPSISEQQHIANFLDHEIAKIDTLIEKQQQLIQLLKEKRQAVISHAVTKGLNPNAPMKDSGVEWTDKVPNHWKVTKLRYYAVISNGATPNRENIAFWENGNIGWLNSSKVNDQIIKSADQFVTELAVLKTSVKAVKENDLVMAITGEGQTRGRVAICKIEATINQHLASISIVNNALLHEFLYIWLVANYERIRFESNAAGSTKGAITCADIESFPIVVPPIGEQHEILALIKNEMLKFDQLETKATSAIELMQERRTALISAAVTGKIDVRNWQAEAVKSMGSK